MRTLFFALVSIALCGCNSDRKISPSVSNSSSSGAVSSKCPEQPTGTLTEVKTIDIEGNQPPIEEKIEIEAGKDKGYTFVGKAGQTLHYEVDKDICAWVFTQANEQLDRLTLPEDGNYILQLSSRKGTKTFDLEIGLDIPTSQRSATNTSKNQKPSSSRGSSTSTASASELTQQQAVDILNAYLKAKSSIMAPPFDRKLVDRYTTGILNQDIQKPGGSIDWLRRNNSYYSYQESKVVNVISFRSDPNKAQIKVEIYEDYTLHTPRGIDYGNTGSSTDRFIYFFAKDGGDWKIEDYQESN